jgi:hypothetical protein
MVLFHYATDVMRILIEMNFLPKGIREGFIVKGVGIGSTYKDSSVRNVEIKGLIEAKEYFL